MVEKDIGEDIFRHAGLMESARHAFTDQKCLGSVLEHHGVAGDQRGGDGIDRGHVGVVPGCDHEHNAVRHAANIALELGVFADLDICKRIRCDLCHVARTLVKASEFTAITHRTAHHARKFRHDLIILSANRGNARHDKFNALGQRASGPRQPVRHERA